MLLLASYFPYHMSLGTDGAWTFSNRHGFPVGANLNKGEIRWNAIWDSYPQGVAQLPGLDSAAFRKLCCPEWLTPDGMPLNEDSVDLYGTTSNPGVSDENMAAYLDRPRILMEAGALGMLFP